MTPQLRTLTVPFDEASTLTGLLDYLVRDDVLCWTRREAGLIGFGELERFTTSGPERFAEAEAWWNSVAAAAVVDDRVQRPGTGPMAFGSFAFSKVSEHLSRLIIPEIVVGSHAGQGFLTQLTLDPEAELTAESAEIRLAAWIEDAAEQSRTVGAEPQGAPRGATTLSTGALTEEQWMDAVAEGVRAIGRGQLDKLVLARDVIAELAEPVRISDILRELAVRYRECWTYAVDGLVGSTPEMLIKVEGGTAQARVLAGTLDRSGAPEDGEAYARQLLGGSDKQRLEHEIAVQSLTRQLRSFTEEMTSPSEPFILELPNVWHLASDVKAELTPQDGKFPTSLSLVEALHPTAAVCGTPREVAGALIRGLERMDRGPYAGPVGWLDAAGNGEWGIALRGAVVEDPQRVRLFAGCGIVEASQPKAELAETWAKFRPMLEALGIRG
ncbi:isochorismate synthase [Paenarthrobacter sp. DKR-5]|uniref:isochorismate synthase n=1 Tax=Paenarthrobacter sp. DKR-5 TaxID=2835535 RepID=UPI001BDD6E45|nr:isochorismate synthase [Paenarthrobacter sp. DKR-5]MBT1001235.1 isochorismate synthase [Paenarthrobacter sp. DKR-5]